MILRFATVLILVGALAGFGISSQGAVAHHQRHISWVFQQHFDHTNAVPGFSPGASRPIVVCNRLDLTELVTGLRQAVADWNGANQFQAFWLFGPGEFFGPCPASSAIHVEVNEGFCNFAPACTAATSADFLGFLSTALIRYDDFLIPCSPDGCRAAFAHELGHVLGLGEQYDEATAACGSGSASIMDGAQVVFEIVGGCDANSPTPVDVARVSGVFSSDASLTPQVIWELPNSASQFVTVFKKANGGSQTYERVVCGGLSAPQAVLFPYSDNPHIGLAFMPYATDGRGVCNQLRVTNNPATAPFYSAKRSTASRNLQSLRYSLFGSITDSVAVHNVAASGMAVNVRSGSEPFTSWWCTEVLSANGVADCQNDAISIPTHVQFQEQFRQRIAMGQGESDDDLCADVREDLSDPQLGGQRDVNSPWDFYSVPDVSPDGVGSLARDSSIDVSDALDVLAWFAVDPLDVRWFNDNNGNGVRDGEEISRVAGPPGATWRTQPSNDQIDLADALIVIGLFGHACV